MSSSRESGFRVMSWSFRTEGLLGPRPGWSSRRAVFLATLRLKDRRRMFYSSAYRWATAVRLSQSVLMMSMSDLDMAQWNW
jgi:hypothetical protein